MLDDFARLLGDTLPAVDVADVRSLLANLNERGMSSSWLYAIHGDPEPWQADVLDPITFVTTTDDGTRAEWSGPGLLLSNACDVQQRDWVLLAACLPFSAFQDERALADAVRSNAKTSLLFLPGLPGVGDTVVDLSLVHPVSTRCLTNSLRNGTKALRCRLSQLGHYLFLAKLTLHLLRPEAKDVARPRGPPVE